MAEPVPLRECRYNQQRVRFISGRKAGGLRMSWSDLLETLDLEFLRLARVGRLATVGAAGFPTVVPVCFELIDEPTPMVVSVLDEKPKHVSDAKLGRVQNILRHPQVGLTVDWYEEDWARLRYVQLRGVARLIHPEDDLHQACLRRLRAKYPQYEAMDLERRLVIAIGEIRAKTWRAK
jgi:PPOX class probable F420-dependent enzyme